ncbi:translation initiation factor IF-2 N-terminal domain-containing protein [Ramlibacter alkalitolerans]|uniref:Translation initiation factor IF-2 N-terminal domain-containing protein n=1 Tax=Ramlibacter alkalitolerans TaxID=2039631 RepID=A0ABS1JL08_9BURK|nr:translation initiation factor IF-2 N-terminal domain-containing protein [Ramlibacter alkalitolerans]MBL0424903.1 hypothetical protein [Ramlibacter alkalitolerans]
MPSLAVDAASDQYAPGTVGAFAAELRKSPDALLEQLRQAGVEKAAASDRLSDADKCQLLGFLQAAHGTSTAERKRITLVKADTAKRAERSKAKALVVVGGLGQFAYEQVDAAGKRLLDRYLELVDEIYARGLLAFDDDDGFDCRYREACRRMAETLKQLRKFVNRVQRAVDGAVRKAGRVERHGGAFFHALKVDGRNLP